ncbi:MAG: hypothetical protein RLZZ253_321 [Verrucomicrobiota bacterium]
MNPVSICLLLVSSASLAFSEEPPLRFNRDIRPILSEHCFACHGFDRHKRDSGLRLDQREEALKPARSGDRAIVPGHPELSTLVERILSSDPEEVMPPPKAHKPLKPEHKERLRRWITQGAPYEPHWAYTPLPKNPPELDPNTAIDHFIDAALKAKSMHPGAPAPANVLFRRLSLDLTGLPPSPEDLRAADTDPGLQESTERLLHSPRFGERWATWWLDAVRFADTVGFHGDQNQRIFPYRDYVIDAFNQNLPFDRFTLEQIAGDLLPDATPTQRVASGFNRLSMMTREGGIQPKEYLAKYMSDRVRAVGSAWLGATIGCAECHDHKFDPITQKDFYSLGAFFADIQQYALYHGVFLPNPDLKGWTDHHPFPPEIEVESPYRQRRLQRFTAELHQIAHTARSAHPEFADWSKATREFLRSQPGGWVFPHSVAESTQFKSQPDGSLALDTNASNSLQFALRIPSGPIAALRIELLPSPEHQNRILRSGDPDTMHLLPSVRLRKADGTLSEPLLFRRGHASHADPTYFQGEQQPDISKGWKPAARHSAEPQSAAWCFQKPVCIADGDQLEVTIAEKRFAPARVRFSVSPLALWDPCALPQADAAPEDALLWLGSTGTDPVALARLLEAEQQMLECRNGKAFSLVSKSVEPAPVRVLPRGNWQDESGPLVLPATPGFLPPLDAAPEHLSRLELARWLTSKQNPVTPRAVMNRLWKQLFGTGLSAVLDDLGAQGEPPSHPELLDWLAAEFRDSGWDFRHMVRLMVRSNAYRRNAGPGSEQDPANRLLATQSPRRLEAEFVRDNALAIAGILDPEIGGPSVHVYFPESLYRDMEFPKRVFEPVADERQWRRGLYMHWQRTFLHPMLASFDAPNRDESACLRTQANTPQQALTLLNDPTFLEAARGFAQRLLQTASTDSDRIQAGFLTALCRLPTSTELERILNLLGASRSEYLAHGENAGALLKTGHLPAPDQVPAPELAAWTTVCRVLLNLHETITRY